MFEFSVSGGQRREMEVLRYRERKLISKRNSLF
jgi:hypothetical protein